MYVYYLTSKQERSPFYIGITNNPERRLKQHKRNKNHLEFVESMDDIVLNVVCDTGNTDYSDVLATYPCGSNKCIDVSQLHFIPNKIHKKKSNRKDVTRWSMIVDEVQKDVFISGEELSELLAIPVPTIDSFVKRTIGMSLKKYLQLYRDLWYKKYEEHIVLKFEW